MKNKVSRVQFALSKITTEQFAILENAFAPKKDIKINTNIRFGADENKNMVACFTAFSFETEQKAFLKIEAGCHFLVIRESWNSMYDSEQQILKLPKGFLTHLAVLTVGATRGILHSKTEGTDYNKFVLPTINLGEMIKEDAEFKFSVKQESIT